MSALVPFDNSYAALPARFSARQDPTPVRAPTLLKLNEGLCEQLGLDPAALRGDEGVAMLAGNAVPDGAAPLAMAYAGHQFGHFVPQLGDGRAILLGELIGADGVRYDLHLKGAGRTKFSRGGDGRAWLGPVLREYLVAEAMHALGVPTTRALAAVATGEPVLRESALPGAVLTRVGQSHVRVGTFQYFAAREDEEALAALTAYVVERHVPAEARDGKSPAEALLDHVAAGQAALVAAWMGVGFIHGVMNTDNTQVAGETIDYGPCAFMDHYDPATVFSSIDRQGRYAYGNQPAIAQWNVARLAEALIPVLDDKDDIALDKAKAGVDRFADLFNRAYLTRFREKVGLWVPADDHAARLDEDKDLLTGLLDGMADHRADFTNTFRALGRAVTGDETEVRAALGAGADAWLARWRQRLAQDPRPDDERRGLMDQVNPAFIPRNHQVEAALDDAVAGDLGRFDRLFDTLRRPYDDQPDQVLLQAPPTPDQVVRATFCGT